MKSKLVKVSLSLVSISVVPRNHPRNHRSRGSADDGSVDDWFRGRWFRGRVEDSCFGLFALRLLLPYVTVRHEEEDIWEGCAKNLPCLLVQEIRMEFRWPK